MEQLKVFIRVRPLSTHETPWDSSRPNNKDKTPVVQYRDGRILTIRKDGRETISEYDAILGSSSTQEDVFDHVSEYIDGVFDGYDCCVLAYGQTGTGKTFTMSGKLHSSKEFPGTDLNLDPNASLGVIPQAITTIFKRVESETSQKKGCQYDIYCSFLEIYNEKVYDMLAPSKLIGQQRSRRRLKGEEKLGTSLRIRQKMDETVFVEGLTCRKMSSEEDMQAVFKEGNCNRSIRDNFYHEHSSRSHAIFQITVRCTTESEKSGSAAIVAGTRVSRLSFVDLAGSERWRAEANKMSNQQHSEMSSINKSLLALTNCVQALTSKRRQHIPFRDSTLTRLLQKSLEGKGRTAFIVTLSPASNAVDESLSSMKFADRVQCITLEPIVKNVINEKLVASQRAYYETQMQNMRLEVSKLKRMLQRAVSNAGKPQENDANQELIAENEKLRRLLRQSEARLEEERERKTIKSNTRDTKSLWSNRTHLPQASQPTTDHEPNTNSDIKSLLNKLQGEEARLNSLLEAEIEAQERNDPAYLIQYHTNLYGQDDGVAPTHAHVSDKVDEARRVDSISGHRRQLIVVPKPVRASVQKKDNLRLFPKPKTLASNIPRGKPKSRAQVLVELDVMRRLRDKLPQISSDAPTRCHRLTRKSDTYHKRQSVFERTSEHELPSMNNYAQVQATSLSRSKVSPRESRHSGQRWKGNIFTREEHVSNFEAYKERRRLELENLVSQL